MSLVDILERRDLAPRIDALVARNLPAFMMWASPGNWRWHRIYELFPEDQVAVLDESGEVVGAVNAVPLAWEGDAETPGGYDDVLVRATDEAKPIENAVTCLLSISVDPSARGSGVPHLLLDEMKRRARRLGRRALVTPLRPTRKAEHPSVPIAEYVTWTTDSGEPFDPWLRTHVRLGAEILGVVERSLVVTQRHERWGGLTGRDLSAPAAYEIPGALAPIVVDRRGVGTYAEPNIWIRHGLSSSSC